MKEEFKNKPLSEMEIQRLKDEAIEIYNDKNFDNDHLTVLSKYLDVLEPYITKMELKTFKMRIEHYILDTLYASEEGAAFKLD